ncbi:MAG TPA: hypothetical protein VN231_07115 [Allosphingosinicella sp.]|nr:hypothetical protein [Allosphingosinicella sp.]
MNATAQDDLSRLRAIAEQGRSVPLLGGWQLILWGGAMTLALLINWAVIERILPWPGYALSLSWFGIVLAAWAGSAMIGRRLAGEPGASSVGNRVEHAAWTTAGAVLLILALALLARALASGEPEAWQSFSMMPPVTFGAYAVALQASAVAGASTTARPYVLVALAFAAGTAFLIDDPLQHLVAAAGIALVSIPAGLGHLRAARRAN